MDPLFWVQCYTFIFSTIVYLIYLRFIANCKQTHAPASQPPPHTSNEMQSRSTKHALEKQRDTRHHDHTLDEEVDITAMLDTLNHQIEQHQKCQKQQQQHQPGSSSSHDDDDDDEDSTSVEYTAKVDANPILIEHVHEIFGTLHYTANGHNTSSADTYYDTAEFDDENEYDSDAINDYDRTNVDETLHRIDDDNCSSSKSAQVIAAPQKIVNANPVESSRPSCEIDSSQSVSSSPSDPQLHRYQTSGSDYDRFIQENLNQFILNDECSSSELGPSNEHTDSQRQRQRRQNHDNPNKIAGSARGERGEADEGEEQEDDHDDMELQLKNCDVDLSQFPTEQECYPTYCD